MLAQGTLNVTGSATNANLFVVNGTQTDTTGIQTNAPVVFSPTVDEQSGAASVGIFRFVPTINMTSGSTIVTVFNNNYTLGLGSGNITNLNSMLITPVFGSTYTGTVTNVIGLSLPTPSYLSGSVTNFLGVSIGANSVASSSVGLAVGDLTSEVNNTSILTGQLVLPTGDWDTYFAANYPAGFIATSTGTTGDKIVLKSTRAAQASGNLMGGIAFWSDDTNLTAPGTKVAGLQALTTQTHTASALGTALTFTTTPNSSIVPAEAMRIDQNGYVGIGTTSPATKLDVNGTITQLTVKSCTLGLTTDDLGSITGCVASDQKLKKNIKPLTSALTTLLKLNPVFYDWKDTKVRDTQNHAGFVAQDVAKVFPQAVVNAGTNLKGVDANAIVSLAVRSIQDFYKQFTTFVQHPVFGTPARPTGITLYDDMDGTPYCIRIHAKEFLKTAGECYGYTK